MGAINFITESNSSKEILKSANLLKKISADVLIEGEEGVGKKTLASYIANHNIVLKAKDFNDGYYGFESFSEGILVLEHIDEIRNYDLLDKFVSENSLRIIATAIKPINERVFERFFSTKIYIPPLQQRPADILPLAHSFSKEIREILNEDDEIELVDGTFDISRNCHSLKRSIFYSYLIQTVDEDMLMDLLEIYISDKIGGKNDYRDFLHLYEVPLLRCSFKKFKSQLQVAEKLGLNRNTLRKKMQEYKEELE
ncbi:MAG: helix-turn-helix domain-containing protein [Campylobacterales bacterium]